MVKKKITIEDLAGMIKHGLDHIATKEELHSEIGQLRSEMATKKELAVLRSETQDSFHHVFARLDLIREELHDLRQRVERLERGVVKK